MTIDKKTLAVSLYRLRQIKIDLTGPGFELKSGKRSPFYVDLRELGSYPELNDLVCAVYGQMLESIEPDHIMGLPEAGTPLASAIAKSCGRRLLWRRVNEKKYGANPASMIVGVYNVGDKVALIDNTISDGKTKLESDKYLRAAGLIAHDHVVLVDRLQGGRQLLESMGKRLTAALTIREFIDAIHAEGCIGRAEHDRLTLHLLDEANRRE